MPMKYPDIALFEITTAKKCDLDKYFINKIKIIIKKIPLDTHTRTGDIRIHTHTHTLPGAYSTTHTDRIVKIFIFY